ncbi:hypothetical protein [Haloferula sp. BvORR071]|uniref:hypothetical protein n=1 Tax=Haloferula sp. BvORR071 TaxID=1396141 RepID=UPI0005587368|nr:hypothetical protein [Haloferula sp. BvORR071]
MKSLHAVFLVAAGVALGTAFPVPRPKPVDAPGPAGGKSAKTFRAASRIPDSIRREINSIRAIKDREGRMRETMRLASTLPIADLQRWYEGNYLEFLDSDTEGLFYMIVEERWMAADPATFARYKIDSKQSNPDPALAAWLKADEAAAMTYINSLDPAHRQNLALSLTRVISKTDLPRALELLDEVLASKSSDTYRARELLGSFATQDREAVLAHIKDWKGSDREWAVKAVGNAWLEKDFAWTVGFLQAEGKGAGTIKDLFNQDGWGKPAKLLTANASSLPDGWMDELAASGSLDIGCGDEWMAMRGPVPGISAEALAKIQLDAAAGGFWDNEKLESGKRFVEEGDWLPLATRAKLAAAILNTWRDGLPAAEAWVASLDEEVRGEAEAKLAEMRKKKTNADIKPLVDRPGEFIKALTADSARNLSDGLAAWSAPQVAEAVAAAKTLDSARAAEILEKGSPDYLRLPPAVKASLAQAAGEDWSGPQAMKGYCQIVSQWAEQDPAAAAKWVEALPAGEQRDWAAKNVVLRWSSYSPAAAKAWEAKLAPSH